MTAVIPSTQRGRAEWLRAASPREARQGCGISLRALAEALGVHYTAARSWELGLTAPRGARGIAYCRVIAGLARHLEVPEGGGS